MTLGRTGGTGRGLTFVGVSGRTCTGRTVARGACTRTVGGVWTARAFARDRSERSNDRDCARIRRSTGARATLTVLPPPREVLVERDELLESLDDEPELEPESSELELDPRSFELESREPRSSLPPRAASLMRPSCAFAGAASATMSAATTAPRMLPLCIRGACGESRRETVILS